VSFTTTQIINDARVLVQDTRATLRYDDATFLMWVNSAVRRIALVRPDLFATFGTVTTVLGNLQSAPTDSLRLIDVHGVVGGSAFKEVDRAQLDMRLPSWTTLTPGTPTNWMRHPRNPNRFFVAVPATAGLSLEVEYAKSPALLVAGDAIPIPDAFFPCVVDGVVWLAESVDNEHVNSGRAKMYADAFDKYLGLTVQNRPLMDSENAMLPPEPK